MWTPGIKLLAAGLVASVLAGQPDAIGGENHASKHTTAPVSWIVERVSLGSDGQPAVYDGPDGYFYEQPKVSRNGRYVLWDSPDSTLVDGDTNGAKDAFVRDLELGTTERISVSTGESQGNADSGAGAISADGRYVTFHSEARNLLPRRFRDDPQYRRYNSLYRRDRQSGVTTLVSLAAGKLLPDESGPISMSPDGRFVVFRSGSTELRDGMPYLFLRDMQRRVTKMVSLNRAGAPMAAIQPVLAAGGRYLLFLSTDRHALMLRDLRLGTTQFLTHLLFRSDHQISANGRWVTFLHGDRGLLVLDRRTGKTEQVNVSSSGQPANRNVGVEVNMSPSGRFIAYCSKATDLVSGVVTAAWRVYLRDRRLGTTVLVSRGLDGHPRRGLDPSMSAGAGSVVFDSNANGLVADDAEGTLDVFLWTAGI